MNEYELYIRRLQAYGNSRADAFVNNTINKINTSFKDSPSYRIAKVNGEEIDVRFIVDKNYSSGKQYAEYKLLLRPNTVIETGSLVEVDNEMWLTFYFKQDKMYPKAYIQKCNNILTFQDKENPAIIHKVPCILRSKASPYATGENEIKYIILSEDQILVTVPNNDTTRQIGLNKRFIFDNSELNIYESTKIDTLTQKGLIYITMKKDQYNEVTDRPDLNLADYVDANEESENSSIEDGYIIEIIGSDTIPIMGTETYTAKIYNNGELVTDKSVIWSVDDRFNIKETTDITCTIEALPANFSTGFYILKATLSDNDSIYAEKEIEITFF